MTFIAQAWHVARKDLRHARWLLLAYVTLIVVAAASSSGALPYSYDELAIASPLLYLVAFVIVATIVHDDSPTRADSYWTTLPLRSGALVAAKGVVVLLMLLPALIAQSWLLQHLGISLERTPPLLLHSVAVFVVWMVASSMLGSVTRDMKGFVLACVVALIAFVMLGSIGLIGGYISALASRGLGWPSMGVGVVVAAGLLLAMYRARDLGRVTWLGAELVVMLLMIAAAVPVTRDRGADRPPEYSTLVGIPSGMSVTADSIGVGPLGVRVQVSLRATVPDSVHRYRVSNVAVDLRGVGGTVASSGDTLIGMAINVGLGSASSSGGNSQAAIPSAPSGTRWTSLVKPSVPVPLAWKDVHVTVEAWERVRAGRALLPVSADVEELRVDTALPLPTPSSGWADVGGVRLRVDPLPNPLYQLGVKWVAIGEPRDHEHERGLRSYALVNDALGESRLLVYAGSGWNTRMAVLPASRLYERTEELALESASNSVEEIRARPTAEWLRGARLVLFRWNVVRRFRAEFGPAVVRTR